MSAAPRRAVLLLGLVAVAVPLTIGLAGLEPFGHYPGPYGIVLERVVEAQRHVSELVTAVVVDYRGLDTLGEEMILLAAAVGCTVLLRIRRSERGEAAPVARPEPSFATTSLGVVLVGPLAVLGAYVVAHGHISPGGGFQAGVVLAAALVAVYVSGQALRLRRVRPESILEALEAVGGGAFAVLGVAGLVFGAAALQNVLPLGQPAELLSGGTMGIANVVIALEVTCAVALVLSEFLDETLVGG